MSEVRLQRQAILEADLEPINFGDQQNAANLYIPLSHIKALKLETSVVVGGRGVGKSFWTAALNSEQLRSHIGIALPELKNLDIAVGYSEKTAYCYPDPESITALLNKGIEPYDVWRAVIARWAAKLADRTDNVPQESWQTTIEWLKEQPEEVKTIMLQANKKKGLLVFDALDRSSNRWQVMDDLVRGLLRALLWLKSFNGLYGKVFLREDQADRTVFTFPDASKLKATQAELTWAKHDLHGLLWQRLINAPAQHGELMRQLLQSLNVKLTSEIEIWLLPNEVKRETDIQRQAFELLAGPWMGKDRRRGVPYVWSVSHLADVRGLASPRSFLAAIQQAAQDSQERYPEYTYALHYESIKRGIQEASVIRVDEVAEDYPWLTSVLGALEGLNVPVEFAEIQARWEERFPNGIKDIENKQLLPAQHETQNWDGILNDLQRLGILETKRDKRIDMPDLYRVGFKLGRRGGVRPVR